MRTSIQKEIIATAKAAQTAELERRRVWRTVLGPSPTSEAMGERATIVNKAKMELYQAEGKLIAFAQMFGRTAVVDLLLADKEITHIPACIIATKKL